MSNIRFKDSTLQDVERIALEHYGSWVNTYERDADLALEHLSVYVDAFDKLSYIEVAMESVSDYNENIHRQYVDKVTAIIGPLGAGFATLVPSNEANSMFSIQGFKEMLRRVWLAIKRTISNIWSFLRKGFSRTFAEHRRVGGSISALRISMNNLRSAVPSTGKVSVTGARLITSNAKAPTYSEIAKGINHFMNVRHALLHRYSVSLTATMKSVLATRGAVKLDDQNQLENIRVSTNKVLQNFDRKSVAAMFPGAKDIDDAITVVDMIGPYELVVSGRQLPPINDPNFMRIARSLSIDINRSGDGSDSNESTAMHVLSFAQMEELLKCAESLINDMARGHTEERAKRTESLVKNFDQWVMTSAKVAEDWVTSNDNQVQAREESLKFFREQASFSTALTAWGGHVFLKTETLALRTAAAIVSLCNAHLKVYS